MRLWVSRLDSLLVPTKGEIGWALGCVCGGEPSEAWAARPDGPQNRSEGFGGPDSRGSGGGKVEDAF